MNLADVRIKNGSLYPNFSLTKLCGKTISDVEVSLTREFGQVSVKLKSIGFTDDTKLWCEGEHDLPYVTDISGTVLPDEDFLNALYNEEIV
jgi:hypothetical protein